MAKTAYQPRFTDSARTTIPLNTDLNKKRVALSANDHMIDEDPCDECGRYGDEHHEDCSFATGYSLMEAEYAQAAGSFKATY